MVRMAVLAAIAAIGVAVAASSGGWQPLPRAAPERSEWRWYKGNTHTHTLQSDGDSTPEEVTQWYRDHDYQFLVLSDHNVLTPVDALTRAFGVGEEFLLIPGTEVTDRVDGKPLHVNGLNVGRAVPPQGGPTMAVALQRDIDAIRAAEGVPHINHPNFGWAVGAGDLAAVARYRLLEIYNGHPMVNNLGGGESPGMEDVWDRLLAAGRRVYGIAVDDAHYFKRPWDPMAPRPGRGWVVVHAPSLDAGALLASLEAGDFYASTGIALDHYRADATAIEVRVRTVGDTRYRIRLSGTSGAAEVVEGPTARFALAGRRGYARVTVTDSNGAQAWGQPVFFE